MTKLQAPMYARQASPPMKAKARQPGTHQASSVARQQPTVHRRGRQGKGGSMRVYCGSCVGGSSTCHTASDCVAKRPTLHSPCSLEKKQLISSPVKARQEGPARSAASA